MKYIERMKEKEEKAKQLEYQKLLQNQLNHQSNLNMLNKICNKIKNRATTKTKPENITQITTQP